MSIKPYFVSVIIPVHNDSSRLITCLKSLQLQTYDRDLYEVIVVDNNSTEDIQAVVQQYSFARYTQESKQGSYAARNKGISLAKGEILAFTDSDCIPAADWIEQGVQALHKDSDRMMVAGKIELFFKTPEQPTVVELYDSMTFLRQKTFVEKLHFGATANLFTYKTCFQTIGLFDTKLKSSGDREWGQRLYKAGYKQAYSDRVCIAHPARSNAQEIYKKTARITEGLYTLQNYQRKSLLSFTQEIFWDLKPPRKEIIEVFRAIQSNSISLKVKYIWLMLNLRWIAAAKKIEIYFRNPQKKIVG